MQDLGRARIKCRPKLDEGYCSRRVVMVVVKQEDME
jgi:hypothetical protein